VGQEGHEKITGALQSKLEQSEEPLLDVVVELIPDPVEADTAPEMQKQFEEAAQPVSAAIAGLGGEVMGSVWLNRTVRAKLPAVKVPELSRLQEVAAVDVPHQIHRD
jgi:hypothetical protein